MHGAEYVWLETLLGNETALLPGDLPGMIPGNQQGEGGIKDFGDLREKWAAWTSVGRLPRGLTPAALEETIYRTRRTGDQEQRFGCRRSDALLHVCNARPLHRHPGNQHAAALRRRKIAGSMLIAMARMEAGVKRLHATTAKRFPIRAPVHHVPGDQR